ncbi:sensor histidine kinase [Streptomyces sp. SRF1]|uniref:sensor histidine kinase n=1 Tax=Streptomyces sp. SRF1 TaxID=1549642 RepID=UPI0025B099D2|nr:sensor histidine kinase [Streptomyces sp. SRF1]MDN3059481.1 sensor histidine kinase [Streptomyces sp. SRF1]
MPTDPKAVPWTTAPSARSAVSIAVPRGGCRARGPDRSPSGALDVAEHRQDADRMLILNDRDRIARDLHDLVIQRLFASALTLQSTLGRLTGQPQTSTRVHQVVDDLDDTIKVIRSTIYSLREQERTRSQSLRTRLVAAMERATQTLGFTPALRMTGLLDTTVPAPHTEHLLATVGEALTNTARHARATSVDVTVEVTGTQLRLEVADNGCGVNPATTRRSGLANLQHRAEELGGSFSLRPNEPTGTVVEWTVPLPTTP